MTASARALELTAIAAEAAAEKLAEDIVALVRTVLSLSPMARVPNVVVERLGDAV